jgi:hypothetical protein
MDGWAESETLGGRPIGKSLGRLFETTYLGRRERLPRVLVIMEVRWEGKLMDLESARRVANLEVANPGF